jgi:hypothetical protein
MFGMLDHQSRISFAREHADRLKDVMRASHRACGFTELWDN